MEFNFSSSAWSIIVNCFVNCITYLFITFTVFPNNVLVNSFMFVSCLFLFEVFWIRYNRSDSSRMESRWSNTLQCSVLILSLKLLSVLTAWIKSPFSLLSRITSTWSLQHNLRFPVPPLSNNFGIKALSPKCNGPR